MKSSELVKKAKDLANHKTIYVKGCEGRPMTDANKLRFTSNNMINARRSQLIFAANNETIGIDEIHLLNYLAGTKFTNFASMMEGCSDISKTFDGIEAGEVVFGNETVGIYVGDRKVVTCNINGVVEVPLNNWASHGKLVGVDYSFREETPAPKAETIDEIKDDEPVKETENVKTKMEVRPNRPGHRH